MSIKSLDDKSGSISRINFKPILHLGVDIGVKRYTSAVSAVYRHPDWQQFVLYCHRIWQPPVHIPSVTDYLRMIISNERVVAIWYDPYQFASEAQKLSEEGHGRIMKEVNQSGPYRS